MSDLARMLKLKQVGTRDNFFELGGHSLLALRVIGEINRTLKVLLIFPYFSGIQLSNDSRELLSRSIMVQAKPRLV